MRQREKPGKSKAETRRRSGGRKSPKNDPSGHRELEKRLAEALEQQTATSEILRIISSSPTDVQPAFDTIVRSAVRLCNGQQGTAWRFDGELMYLTAHDNLTPENLRILHQMSPMRPDSRLTAARAINTDPSASQSLDLAMAAERYTLTAPSLDATSMQLNGSDLKLGEDDAMPRLTGISTGSGRLTFPPATITFLAIPNANNGSCH